MKLLHSSCMLISSSSGGIVRRKLASPVRVCAQLQPPPFPSVVVVACDTAESSQFSNQRRALQASSSKCACWRHENRPVIPTSLVYSSLHSSDSRKHGRGSQLLTSGLLRQHCCSAAVRSGVSKEGLSDSGKDLKSRSLPRCSSFVCVSWCFACSALWEGGSTSVPQLRRHCHRSLTTTTATACLGSRTPLDLASVVAKGGMMLSSSAGGSPSSSCDGNQQKPCIGLERTTAACLQVPQNDQTLTPMAMSCVLPADLGSVEGLARWLEERIPGGDAVIRLWGQARGTKRVANLWTELVQGEIVLEDARPPKRIVHVASVRIRNQAGHILLESRQEMGDGTVRTRNRPLSEKMRPSETVVEACLRGIHEELGDKFGAPERVTLREGTYLRAEEERSSFSYPGLPTRYIVHTMDAFVDRLPDGDFETEENEEHPSPNEASTSDEKQEADLDAEAWDTEPSGQMEQASSIQGNGGGRILEQDMKSLVAKGPVGVKKHFWIWVREEAYKEFVT